MDYNIPDDLKYTRDHEWVAVKEDNVIVLGVTDYAQDQLEDIVYLELPETGLEISAGDAFGSVEAVKAVEDIYTPVSGEVVEINEALEDKPELCNQDPYGEGWLVKIKCSDMSEVDGLLSADDYKGLIG
ncbi:MAG: glycine cleavage system protein GcvH [bacterium]|nr:glycine cleavage system protein GcvH [bacterium]